MTGTQGLVEQSQITICTPVISDKKWQSVRDAEINAILDQFGNPIGDETNSAPNSPAANKSGVALKAALEKTGIVHFLSVFVVPADDDMKQSHLILEMTVDGDKKAAIERLVTEAGDVLLPIYRLAAGVETVAGLLKHFKKKYQTIRSKFPFFGVLPRKAAGLEWLGTKSLSIDRVKRDQEVFEIARQELSKVRECEAKGSAPPTTALSKIKTIKTAILENADCEIVEHIEDSNGELDFAKDDPKTASRTKVLTSVLWKPLARQFCILWALVASVQVYVQHVNPPGFEGSSSPVWVWLAIGLSTFFLSLLIALILYTGAANMILGQPTDRNDKLIVAPQNPRRTLVILVSLLAVIGFAYAAFVAPSRSLGVDNPIYHFGTVFVRALFWSFVASLMLFGLLIGVFVGLLRMSESQNTPIDDDPSFSSMQQISMRENRTPQHNHMISVTTVIPRRIRSFFTLPLGLMMVANRHKLDTARPGFLGGIGTIHSARFIRLPGTRKLVFMSNYNGSWESYLEDFIQKGSEGMTGIWSNCVGFPKTEFLINKGCKDGDRFKRFARRSMIPTRLWYSAYPDKTAAQIRRNALVTRGLALDPSTTNAEAWVDLFGSVQRPNDALEFEDIQSIILRGDRKRRFGTCQTVTFPAEASLQDLQAWVSEMTKSVNLGRVDRPVRTKDSQASEDATREVAPAVYLAFSSIGLERLGVPGVSPTEDDAVKEVGPHFPSAFRLGMDHPSRENTLGDTGRNSPDSWNWGQNWPRRKPETGAKVQRTHAVLLLYAETEASLLSVQNDVARIWAEKFGWHDMGPAIELSQLPQCRNKKVEEPFGWADGISQPRIRGVSWKGDPDPVNTVEAGEFILGYKDNRGYYPPSPMVASSADPLQNLPDPAETLAREFPSYGISGKKDFGRNGTFLVIRQLEQDVCGFNKWLSEETCRQNEGRDENNKLSEEFVGSKLVGRWKNGAPFVRYPGNAGAPDASDYKNSFLYGPEDSQGHRCPLGAHIRRANPRDSLDFKNPKALEVANRHRLLRRGRPYDDGNRKKAGTFFVCLNADLERQFEFVQQNWINGTQFHALPGEIDPIAGQSAGDGTFTVPSELGPGTLKGLTSFVTVKGGGYFFLPSRRALNFLSGEHATTVQAPHIQGNDVGFINLSVGDPP